MTIKKYVKVKFENGKPVNITVLNLEEADRYYEELGNAVCDHDLTPKQAEEMWQRYLDTGKKEEIY
jgi:hypothetical protein